MDNSIYDVIDTCLSYRVTEILFVSAAVLVLIDYLFPTDLPAHLGYFCLGAAVFFVAYLNALGLGWCLFAAIGFWILLAILHQAWFRTYLENAPGTPGYRD